MNSVELIKKICKEHKIPISRLERELGYGNGYFGQLRKGTIPSDRAIEIANYLSIDLEYLLNGGENLIATDTAYNGVEYVRELCVDNNIPISVLEKECNFSNGYLNPKKINKVTYERALAIENFLNSNGIIVDRNKLLGVLEEDFGSINMYEIFESLLTQHGVTAYRVGKETGIPASTFSDWKKGKSKPKNEKLQKIADYFGVTVEYLMTGKDETEKKESVITARDARDIAIDLNNIMEKLTSGEAGPATYGGMVLDTEAAAIFKDELDIALRRLKLINKEKYTPKKYKK